MQYFIIRFFLINLFICIPTGILLLTKRVCRHILTSHMQYHLWFVFLGLLAIPFLPVSFSGFHALLFRLSPFEEGASFDIYRLAAKTPFSLNPASAGRINDFTLSVSRNTLSSFGLFLWIFWLTGVLIMMFLIIQVKIRFNRIQRSALPVQSREVRSLYQSCLKEMHILREIPIYSTVFLKSPVIAGFFSPKIYLPISLIRDCEPAAMRHILLHELQHYKHRDALANGLMNLAAVLYWFHPLVRRALKEMQNDRELACDSSVLNLLEENEYKAYGNTLIRLAGHVSHPAFPFASGMSNGMKQMKRRIANIAAYEKPSARKRRKGRLAFLMTAFVLICFAPALSVDGADDSYYSWDTASKRISVMDASDYFGAYEGCFVFYDLESDVWQIFEPKLAVRRSAPDSTYKIYNGLFALEEGLLTPADSFMAWDGTPYPFDAWNQDQTLSSAMDASVNWYFQSLDEQLGSGRISQYLREVGYGNRKIGKGSANYWLESSLKISPIEQVELLADLYKNTWGFAPENVRAVQDSILLSSTEQGRFYGKTGTGRVDGKDVNGWFVGYVELPSRTCFFAVNIQADDHADGSRAAEITAEILSDLL